MSARGRSWTPRLPPVTELALAAGVAVVMSADTPNAAWPVPALLLSLLAGATLAWRLTVPWLPLLATCAVDLLLMATATTRFGPQTTVLGVLVAVYSAATHLAGRRALTWGIVSLTLVWAAHVASPDGDPGDFLPFVVWGLPWVAGRLVRRQTLAAHEAGARAALLEVDAREAASRERDRIARELHDVVGHAVSLMVVQAGAERLALGSGGLPRTRAALASIESSGRQALVELRAMLGVLRSTESVDERTPQPTLAALPELVEQVRRAGLPVTLSLPQGKDVPPGLALTAYRLVQESLTNALRHAGPVPTTVDVEVDHDLRVRVANALPRRPAVGSEGRGLVGMRERVTLHGGAITAGPQNGCWIVDARLPLLARELGA
jgi:signal transduction histidine kinase